jgi:predicted metalloprotease with PDZ domain
LATKIINAKRFDDRMPFTKMSKQVLAKPYKDNYLNVYEKGALIAMCLDIELRTLSQGATGILDMMQKLSSEYGSNKPFDDAELFDKIVSLTYPEIRTFLDTYIAGDQPIPYEEFVGKMGVAFAEMEIPQNVFFVGQTPFITINPSTMELMLIAGIDLPAFYEKLGIQGGDILLEFNGVKYNAQNAYDLISESMAWKTGDDIQVKFKRDGKEADVKGKVVLPTQTVEGLKADENKQKSLRTSWLKG